MKQSDVFVLSGLLVILLMVGGAGGCATGETHHVTSAVDYLYPDKEPVVAPGIPLLNIPLRVGIAFVPSSGGLDSRGRRTSGEFIPYQSGDIVLTEKRRMDLMQEVATYFKKYAYVKDIEIIPSAYLKTHGSFTNLDQIRTMYGVDVIALLSYDQVQFMDQGAISLTYWTIVGAYVIPGQKNDTHTMLDAVVFDIKSRKMLFRAPGTSHIQGNATPVNLSEQLRADSDKGFSIAAKEMITNLDEQLSLFKEKVKERPTEYTVVTSPGYNSAGTGGGNVDLIMLLLMVFMGGSFLWIRRRA
jgi:rhombotail lipoprotein